MTVGGLIDWLINILAVLTITTSDWIQETKLTALPKSATEMEYWEVAAGHNHCLSHFVIFQYVHWMCIL